MPTRRIQLLTFCAALSGVAHAQRVFEVAVIKPNAGDDHRILFRMTPGGGFSATGMTLRMLIMHAYDIRGYQISGGPGWTETDRFDIQAKVAGLPERVSMDDFRPALQALLAERFQLRLRRETREMTLYALVSGKGPHKMKSSAPDSAAAGTRMRVAPGHLALSGSTMARFAQALALPLERPVVDQTGIAGSFDIELRWTPEAKSSNPDEIAAGPSLFTAIQEELGLKLEKRKGPVELFVIDSAAKPTEN